jgi:hypothetical protein
MTITEAVTPHASPMISEPRFGSMNSALEMTPKILIVLRMSRLLVSSISPIMEISFAIAVLVKL